MTELAAIANAHVASISIHTFRVEGDRYYKRVFAFHGNNFNPHLPCGRWLICSSILNCLRRFQSTPSVWKVTFQSVSAVTIMHRISIHTFRVEGDFIINAGSNQSSISIHTFRVEGDAIQHDGDLSRIISIHTFRVEGDERYAESIHEHISISIHTFRVEGDNGRTVDEVLSQSISIHTFRVEGDRSLRLTRQCQMNISIHTFRVEGDTAGENITITDDDFNPHLPCGRWRRQARRRHKNSFISIHTFRVEGDKVTSAVVLLMSISIHTFRVEGDNYLHQHSDMCSYFNPHLPCGRWLLQQCYYHYIRSISIHTFRVEGDNSSLSSLYKLRISIHTFRVEGDCKKQQQYFLGYKISIHTFRVEGDSDDWCFRSYRYDFNPHLPCGRWQRLCPQCFANGQFQSTPSVWKVTLLDAYTIYFEYISIHTFRVEGDLASILFPGQVRIFQSTPSVWKVTALITSILPKPYISIHTFRVEGDCPH